jgi:hypothetical protein
MNTCAESNKRFDNFIVTSRNCHVERCLTIDVFGVDVFARRHERMNNPRIF